MISPITLTEQQTPEWILNIHAYDAIELHPLAQADGDYILLDAPRRGCHWGVYLHLKEGGIDNIAVFRSEAEAKAEEARLINTWPHLTGPWKLAPRETHATSTIKRCYDGKPVARIYGGDPLATYIVNLHNANLRRLAGSDYQQTWRHRAVAGTAIANHILAYAARTGGTADHPILSRLLGMLAQAQSALEIVADKVVYEDGETVTSLEQSDIDDIYNASTTLLAELEGLIVEAERLLETQNSSIDA